MNLGNYELNTIVCGDSAVLLKGLPDDCVDLTVTSPPYDKLRKYNGFVFDFETIARELYRVTKQGGVVVWVVGDQTVAGSETLTSFKQALFFKEVCGFRVHDTMFYWTAKAPLSHNRYEQEIEYMFVLSKGRPKTFNPIRIPCKYFGIDKRRGGHYTHNGGYAEDKRVRNGKKRTAPKPTKTKGNLWDYKTGAGHSGDELAFEHPATFPEDLVRDHVLSWSSPGDVVLDPFCGAGTTPKIASIYGRNWLGFEISEKYTELSRARVTKVMAPLPLFDALIQASELARQGELRILVPG